MDAVFNILPGGNMMQLVRVDSLDTLSYLRTMLTATPSYYANGQWRQGQPMCMLYNDAYAPAGLWNGMLANKDVHINILGLQNIKREHINVKDVVQFLVKDVDVPFEYRPYQLSAAAYTILYGKSSQMLGTSAGKTFVCYLSIRAQLQFLGVKRILVLVPDTTLVKQFYDDFKLYDLQEALKVYKIHRGSDNDIEEHECNVICMSYTSAIKMCDDWPELYASFDSVFIDEAHKAKTATLHNILRHLVHVTNRCGVTGSMKEDLSDYDRLVIESYVGANVYNVPVRHLIENGWATKIYVQPIVIEHTIEASSAFADIISVGAKEDSPLLIIDDKNALQNAERNFIAADEEVAIRVCNMMNGVAGNGNIIMFSEGRTAQVLQSYKAACENMSNYKVHCIYGATPQHDRDAILSIMKAEPAGHCLVTTVSCMGMGKSVPSLAHAVILNAGKSFYQIMQLIGRLLRLHDAKSFAIIWDVAVKFNLMGPLKVRNTLRPAYAKANYSLRHQNARLRICNDEQHPVLTTKYIKL